MQCRKNQFALALALSKTGSTFQTGLIKKLKEICSLATKVLSTLNISEI